MASVPQLPALGNGFPKGVYLNILDGTPGSVYFANQIGQGSHTYECMMTLNQPGGGNAQIPGTQLLTQDMNVVRAPLSVQASSALAGATWHLTCIAAKEAAGSPFPTITVAYDGSALPAMPGGVIPAGVTIVEQPWQIEDGTCREGYIEPTPSSMPQAYFPVYFIPNFKMQLQPNYTTSFVGAAESGWNATLVKPLGLNQPADQLTGTASIVWTGGTAGAGLTVTPQFGFNNSSKGVTGINFMLLGGQVPSPIPGGPNPTGVLTINVTQNITYLKGDVLVTENITLLNRAINLVVSTTADTAGPTIPLFDCQNKTLQTASPSGSNLWFSGSTDPSMGASNYIGGALAFNLTASKPDGTSPLTKAVVIYDPNSNGTAFHTLATINLTGNISSYQITIPASVTSTIPHGTAGTVIVKVYDEVGNVTKAYSTISGQILPGYLGFTIDEPSCVAINSTAVPGGSGPYVYESTTTFMVDVSLSGMIDHVDFYVDNVKIGTKLGGPHGVQALGLATGHLSFGPVSLQWSTPNHTLRVDLIDTAGNTHTVTASYNSMSAIGLPVGQTFPVPFTVVS